MFITSFGEQNITYKCCSNFLIHLYATYQGYTVSASEDDSGLIIQAGAGYNFTPNLAAEVAYTHVNAFDGFNGVNAQLKYNF
ncbi:hypothetical protein CTY56_03290 [Acinetobacter baumannii]|nr:hypothetical protein [Acinetobacter baumannii]MDB0323793.1 hypothetical protein [Acinetobacter baumannii]